MCVRRVEKVASCVRVRVVWLKNRCLNGRGAGFICFEMMLEGVISVVYGLSIADDFGIVINDVRYFTFFFFSFL